MSILYFLASKVYFNSAIIFEHFKQKCPKYFKNSTINHTYQWDSHRGELLGPRIGKELELQLWREQFAEMQHVWDLPKSLSSGAAPSQGGSTAGAQGPGHFCPMWDSWMGARALDWPTLSDLHHSLRLSSQFCLLLPVFLQMCNTACRLSPD